MKKIILFAAVICLLTGCGRKVKNNAQPAESSDIIQTAENVVTDAGDINKEKADEPEVTQKRVIVNPVYVNYKNESGDDLQEYESVSDIDLNRPSSLRPNEVFKGWNNTGTVDQITDRTVDFSSVIDLESDTVDITDTKNVLYNDAVYVDNDIPVKFSVPVSAGGTTDFCVLDLEIEYDGELMEFVEFENVDPDAVCNCLKDENRILVTFSSAANISGQLDLCTAVFMTKGSDPAETSLKYNVRDIAAWDSDTSDFYDVRYTVIDSKIVMY